MNLLIQELLYGKKFPRAIDPATHKAIDFLTAGAFFTLAGAFWGRHRRASAIALINAMGVLSATLLTDYDGDGRHPISFPTHGKIDIAQAGTASALPVLLGFPSHWTAMIFQTQAMEECIVVAATDWEATQRKGDEAQVA